MSMRCSSSWTKAPSVIAEPEPIELSKEYRERARMMLAFVFRLVEYLSSYRNAYEL